MLKLNEKLKDFVKAIKFEIKFCSDWNITKD